MAFKLVENTTTLFSFFISFPFFFFEEVYVMKKTTTREIIHHHQYLSLGLNDDAHTLPDAPRRHYNDAHTWTKTSHSVAWTIAFVVCEESIYTTVQYSVYETAPTLCAIAVANTTSTLSSFPCALNPFAKRHGRTTGSTERGEEPATTTTPCDGARASWRFSRQPPK